VLVRLRHGDGPAEQRFKVVDGPGEARRDVRRRLCLGRLARSSRVPAAIAERISARTASMQTGRSGSIAPASGASTRSRAISRARVETRHHAQRQVLAHPAPQFHDDGCTVVNFSQPAGLPRRRLE